MGREREKGELWDPTAARDLHPILPVPHRCERPRGEWMNGPRSQRESDARDELTARRVSTPVATSGGTVFYDRELSQGREARGCYHAASGGGGGHAATPRGPCGRVQHHQHQEQVAAPRADRDDRLQGHVARTHRYIRKGTDGVAAQGWNAPDSTRTVETEQCTGARWIAASPVYEGWRQIGVPFGS
ncbi:unnamed protein product [Lampetra planeri]